MTKNEYNGWYNYETWIVALWLDNEEGIQNFINEQAQEFFDEAEPDTYNTKRQAATHTMADWLETYHRDQAFEFSLRGVFADLMNASLSEVNWYDIAKHYIDSIVEEEPEQESKEGQVSA